MKLQASPQGVYGFTSFGPGVIAGFSSRNYDNTRREEFLQELSLQSKNLVMVKQVHEDVVAVVDRPDPALLETHADGLMTRTPGLVLGIRTADCVPVFFWDPVRKVAGIAHGGWKGIKKGIIHRMLKIFEGQFGTQPKDLCIGIGPSIRQCCYEVGKEFLGYFPGFYHAKDSAKGHLDLAGAIQSQLVKRGVPVDQIDDSELCTVCENERFFSYRVEQQTKERILSVISILG